MELTSLPGHEPVGKGLDDLGRGVESNEALLVSIGEPRLRQAGIEVPKPLASPSIASTSGSPPRTPTRPTAATTRSSAGLSASSGRPMRSLADADRIRAFMRAAGAAAQHKDVRYLTGGATAVHGRSASLGRCGARGEGDLIEESRSWRRSMTHAQASLGDDIEVIP